MRGAPLGSCFPAQRMFQIALMARANDMHRPSKQPPRAHLFSGLTVVVRRSSGSRFTVLNVRETQKHKHHDRCDLACTIRRKPGILVFRIDHLFVIANGRSYSSRRKAFFLIHFSTLVSRRSTRLGGWRIRTPSNDGPHYEYSTHPHATDGTVYLQFVKELSAVWR